MDVPRKATNLSLVPRDAVILPFVDGNLVRHVATMRQRGLAANTIRSRTEVLRLLINHAQKPLAEITEPDMEAWQNTLGPLALTSRATYITHVRQVYRWMLDRGVIDTDPSAVLVRPRTPRALPWPVPEQSLERALMLAPPTMRLWLELAGYEGLRCLEIAGLERSDVQDQAAEPFLYIRGKGGRTRVVPLSPAPVASFRALGMPARGRIFRRATGVPVTAKDVSRRANAYLHSIGIPETIHKFRHRFGTQLYRASGHDLRLVQEQMGHSSPTTTAGYTLVDPTAAAPAVEAIGHPLLRPVQDTGS